MKLILALILTLSSIMTLAQQKTKVPSYFGFQFSPIFPTRFIGEPELILNTTVADSFDFSSTITQKIGYSFGGTVRAGLTKLISLETGINFVHRNFDIDMIVPDSNVVTIRSMLVQYDHGLSSSSSPTNPA